MVHGRGWGYGYADEIYADDWRSGTVSTTASGIIETGVGSLPT